jgi:predicted  nucleic acid-binding Zn-ribbon protein
VARAPSPASFRASSDDADRIAHLENEVSDLRKEVVDLKQELASFRKQFE